MGTIMYMRIFAVEGPNDRQDLYRKRGFLRDFDGMPCMISNGICR